MGHSNLTIIEAVETLTNIVDLDLDHDFGIAHKHEIILQDERIQYKTVHWLDQKNAGNTVNLIRETFRVILHYLKNFYRQEYNYVTDQKTIDGIKTIMVLVGEAAKKLDKYTRLFQQSQKVSVTEFKEYRQLQDFYLSKIAPTIDEKLLSKWVLGLSLAPKTDSIAEEELEQPPIEGIEESHHVFVDLDGVKKDAEYELFFIRKEDGSRFFNPRLLRNIKLVCDFGNYFGENRGVDPLESISLWQDRLMHTFAHEMLKSLGGKVQYFFHELRKNKNHEIIPILSKALMALMLSAQSQNSLKNNPIKSCTEYFQDFLIFLREGLRSSTYQKWIAYPPKETNTAAIDIIDIFHTMTHTLYKGLRGMGEMTPLIDQLLKDSHDKTTQEGENPHVSKKLFGDYAALSKQLRRHPNGPLFKVLNLLEEEAFHAFDPLMQDFIPHTLYELAFGQDHHQHLRFPCPIYQEFIDKAFITPEFKDFIRGLSGKAPMKGHLVFNLQDRTSWREHARCAVLEDLQNQEGMEALTVVTLPFDTDFYHQLSPYHELNHADSFMQQFKEHLLSSQSGFHFPNGLMGNDYENFIDRSFAFIHRFFFSNKNVLPKAKRLDFIEIFYLLLQLKIIDQVKPASFSFTCKDSIDIGSTQSAALFVFVKLMKGQKMSEEDWKLLNLILYGPALLARERLMIADRFNRFASLVRTLETAAEEKGKELPLNINEESLPLFSRSLLEAQI